VIGGSNGINALSAGLNTNTSTTVTVNGAGGATGQNGFGVSALSISGSLNSGELDATTTVKGGADAALTGHTEPLLAADLGGRTLDLASGLRGVGTGAAGSELGDEGLVDDGLVRIDTEHRVLHVDRLFGLSGQVNDLQLHDEASLSASSVATTVPGTMAGR